MTGVVSALPLAPQTPRRRPAPRVAAPATDEPGPPVTVPRIPGREAAERELAKPRYTADDPGLLRRALDWIVDRIAGILESVAFATPGGWLGLLVIALLAIALIVALRLRLGALGTATGPGGTPVLPDRPRSAAEHRAAADGHAEAGRWDLAVQERMRALVRSLEERALLTPRPGRTADEAATEAGGPLPTLTSRLRSAAETFDAVTYGGRHATPADHAALRDLDITLRHTTPEHDPPAGTSP